MKTKKIKKKTATKRPMKKEENRHKLKKKGMDTLKHNINLHLCRFKEETRNKKLDPKIKYRLIYFLDKMKNENAVNKKMRFIVDTNWRDKMRKSKTASLKMDFINYVQFRDVQLISKQRRIESLVKQFNECQDIGKHMEKIVSFDFKNKLINNLKEIIKKLNLTYTMQVEFIKFEFLKETQTLKEIHLNRLQQINSYINAIEIISINEFKHLDVHFKQLKDEQNTIHKNEMLNLKVAYESKTNALEISIKSLINDYEKNQKENLKKYFDLCNIVKESEVANLKENYHFKSLTSEFKNLKTKPILTDILNLKKETFKELKMKKINKIQEINLKRKIILKSIKKLSSITNETIEALKLKYLKACRILKFIKLCSKLEYFDRFEDNYQNYEKLSCASFIENFSQENYLINFYKRYNFLQLNVEVLKAERKRRIDENELLKNQLNDYLNAVSSPFTKK